MSTESVVDSPAPDRRLNSWKEIGAFFGKDERTVKRWEAQRGLPVHRLPGSARTTVFAFAGELEQWLRSGRVERQAADAVGPATPRPWAWPVVAAGALALVALGVAAEVLVNRAPVAPHVATATTPPRHQPSAAAADLYLRGTYFWNTRTPDSLREARRLFDAAIAADPAYAEAYVGLANAYNLLTQYTDMPAATAYPLAKAAAEHAIALDANLSDAYAALAFTTFYWAHDLAKSRALFERALTLNPDASRTLHWYALVTMHSGDFAEPLRAITHAQELEPESRSILANKGLILFYAGHADEAVALLEDLKTTAPEFLPPHYYLATIHLDRGQYGDYIRESLEAARLEGNDAMRATFTAASLALASGGAPAMFTAILTSQTAQYAAGKETAFNVARTAASLGDLQTALDYLEKSKAADEPDIIGIRLDPQLKPLHTDPRFKTLADAVF
ncbi:MAG: hypothetical protein WDM94_11835 [Bauldia sp.]